MRSAAYPKLTSQCYAGADEPSQCIAQKEDYMECLHKTKEVSGRGCHSSGAGTARSLNMQIERAQEIKKTFVKNSAREGTDARKAAEKASTGVIVNLGLVHDN